MKNVVKYVSLLSEDLYKETLEHVDSIIKNKSNLLITNLAWQDSLKGKSGLIARYEFGKNDMEILRKIKLECQKKIPYFISKVVLHLMPPLSYITWHDDTHVKAALTVYLNENWDEDWGGYLMYKENTEIKAIKPEKNLGVLQENGVEHCVSSINIGADYRMSLQFFLDIEQKLL
jgi:Rps23 Pro-64 3,4-dihydroxylase Tpa1-like proline 4-hydroxylase